MKGLAFLGVVGLGVVLVLGTILNGIALSIMWGWFIVPVFAAPPITVPAAIGLSIIIGYLTSDLSLKREVSEDTTEAVIKLIMISILKPLAYLGFGYVVTLFM